MIHAKKMLVINEVVSDQIQDLFVMMDQNSGCYAWLLWYNQMVQSLDFSSPANQNETKK